MHNQRVKHCLVGAHRGTIGDLSRLRAAGLGTVQELRKVLLRAFSLFAFLAGLSHAL